MMDKRVERQPRVINTFEAFRAILRVLYPQRPALADEIKSPAWFVWPSAPDEVRVADKADKLLRAKIIEQRIRLRGVLNPTEPPIDIDPIDAAEGRLDIFTGMLVIGSNGRTQRNYTSVHCIADDIESIVGELPRPAAPQQKGDLEKLYRDHVEANKGPGPWTTIKQDKAWAKKNRITRNRMRELRNRSRRESLPDYDRARLGGVLPKGGN